MQFHLLISTQHGLITRFLFLFICLNKWILCVCLLCALTFIYLLKFDYFSMNACRSNLFKLSVHLHTYERLLFSIKIFMYKLLSSHCQNFYDRLTLWIYKAWWILLILLYLSRCQIYYERLTLWIHKAWWIRLSLLYI